VRIALLYEESCLNEYPMKNNICQSRVLALIQGIDEQIWPTIEGE